MAAGRSSGAADATAPARAWRWAVVGEELLEAPEAEAEAEGRGVRGEAEEGAADLGAEGDALVEAVEVVEAVALRVEEVQHGQELLLVVERGGRREEEDGGGRGGEVGEGVVLGPGGGLPGPVGGAVRLVDDEEVEVRGRAVAPNGVDPGEGADEDAAVRGEGVEPVAEFELPLAHEGVGDEDEDAGVGAVEEGLPDDGAGLDGLAQADLVGEEVAPDGVLEDPTDDADLVGEEEDGGGGEAGEGRSGALVGDGLGERGALDVEVGRVVGLEGEGVGGVGDGAPAADGHGGRREEGALAVGEVDLELAVEFADDPPRAPPALVAGVAAGLGGGEGPVETLGVPLVGGRRAGGVEVLDLGSAVLEGHDAAEAEAVVGVEGEVTDGEVSGGRPRSRGVGGVAEEGGEAEGLPRVGGADPEGPVPDDRFWEPQVVSDVVEREAERGGTVGEPPPNHERGEESGGRPNIRSCVTARFEVPDRLCRAQSAGARSPGPHGTHSGVGGRPLRHVVGRSLTARGDFLVSRGPQAEANRGRGAASRARTRRTGAPCTPAATMP